VSTLNRKSWQDVRRRWARSLLTTLTIAVAVTGLGLFSLPSLMDRAMNAQVAHDQLHDVRLSTDDLRLSEQDKADLRALPGVEGIEFRALYHARARTGDHREDVLLVGTEDFEHQAVNVIAQQSGTWPAAGQALTESQNARSGRLSPHAGQTVQIESNAGELVPISISGTGRTLEYSQVAGDDLAVLYLPAADVNRIAGSNGFNSLEVRSSGGDPNVVAAAVRDWLEAHHPEVTFSDLPEIRAAGTWPGQEVFDNFVTLFYVGGVLALISAVALISNTMTTLVAEQRREIAVMKAIGGRRRQIALSFLRTAFLFAATGSVIGALLGIVVGNLMTQFIGHQFLGVDAGWGIAWPVVIISLAIGVFGTTLAAIPALIRGASLPVREGLQSAIPGSGEGTVRLLSRVPLPATTSMGLRNISRRKARAIGTMFQVALAVGVSLGLLALGVTVTSLTAKTWDSYDWDVIVSQKSNTPLDSHAGELLAGMEGVSQVQPLLYNNLRLDGEEYETWGYPPDSDLYHPKITAGRWLTPEDGASKARVVVVGRALAAKAGLKVGQVVTVDSARGPVQLTVVGIDKVLTNNATGVFVPFSTFQDILGRDDTNAYWLVASDSSHAAIDRVAAQAEDQLTAAGYPAATEIRYVEKAANVSSNKTLTGVLAVMGIPIVVIGLIGLINMMTMNIIERTREIGILRCLGARSGDIKGIFRTEALAVAFLGWLVAIPMGWLIGKVLVEIVSRVFNFGSLPFTYPLLYPPLALGAVVVLSLLVVIAPLRRAAHLRPGDALRYE
jgi:putative ABC transport system permease protein